MPPTARESYQAADITTAPPQKLQLLLIEATLRSAHAPASNGAPSSLKRLSSRFSTPRRS